MLSTSFLMQTATVAAVLCLALMSSVEAFSPAFVRPSSLTASTTSLSASPVSRQDFVKTLLVASSAAAVGLSPLTASAEDTKTLDNGVKVVVNQAGDGPQPDIGELAAIRFRAFFGSTKIDDIFDTPEPYYTRIGNGGMLKVSDTQGQRQRGRVGDELFLLPLCGTFRARIHKLFILRFSRTSCPATHKYTLVSKQSSLCTPLHFTPTHCHYSCSIYRASNKRCL